MMSDLRACAAILDRLCPMHALVGRDGAILWAGPTLQKLRPQFDWVGTRFLDAFELRRPRNVTAWADVERAAGRKLRLHLRTEPQTAFKGIAIPIDGQGTHVVNLSFGISILDAVRDYALTSADFATTDLAIEMLYMVEAKSAAMDASRRLNERLQGAKTAAEEQAFTDTLTRLKNRRALDTVLERMVAARKPLAVAHIDLDYFKAVNDRFGHAAGDHVLSHVADAFRASLRTRDVIARVGGDEFVAILPGAAGPDELGPLLERLIEAVQRPIPWDQVACQVSCSIGVTLWNGAAPTSAQTLIDDADIALYASKRNGRSRVTFYAPVLREEAQAYALPEEPSIEMVELWQYPRMLP